ncbi:MAG: YIP1 family protein [Acidobacteria bacterium]|nr:YIP1 family protein [Acidobacteriota bacterium]
MSDADNQAPMSFVQRLINIFVSPSKVFHALAARPVWIGPLILITLYVFTLNSAVFMTKTGEEALKQQIRESPQGANMPEESMGQAVGFGKVIAAVSVLIGVPVITFAGAGIVYLLFSVLLGGEATYKQTLSAWAHTGLIGLVGGLVQTGMIFMKGSLKSSTTLSAFLPFLEESSFLFKVFQGLDVFLIWQLAVLSIGMGIMNRVGTRKAAIALFSALLAIVVIIAGIRQAMA